MANQQQYLETFGRLGDFFLFLSGKKDLNEENHTKFKIFLDEFENFLRRAEERNHWFTQENIKFALENWGKALNESNLNKWIKEYNFAENQKKIGLITAGNIPLVGFHDILSVLLSGNIALVKPSSKDEVLFDLIHEFIKKTDEDLSLRIQKVEKLKNYDAVIATGSNNTAKYFEYYFREIPHIIRKNRTSATVLSGDESSEDLQKLSEDLFRYFGLGCRNVTKLYVPKKFDLDRLFEAFFHWKDSLFNHNKYYHNYEYNRAIYLMKEENFLDNNFVILKENKDLFSPIGVVHYSYYDDLEQAKKDLIENRESIQCVASNVNLNLPNQVNLGETQKPKLTDYADGINTLDFLNSLS